MKNNEPAFPHPRIVLTGKDREVIVNPSEGMSLRDYFAAKAMQGMVSAHNQDGEWTGCGDKKMNKIVVEIAYSIADAMLSEREK